MCNLSRASEIILVAGGIGITPILSLLRQMRHIYAVHSSSSRSALNQQCQLPPITVIWVVRQGFLVSLFCEQLMEVFRSHFSLSLITIKIYHTANIALPAEVPPEVKSVTSSGIRPDISGIFAAAKNRSSHRDSQPSAVHAIACGPEALTSSVQLNWCVSYMCLCFVNLALSLPSPLLHSQLNGFTFFSEDFYF